MHINKFKILFHIQLLEATIKDIHQLFQFQDN
jgi:hypothetical protein